MADVQTIQGDCLDVICGMDSDSFDTIITDPPYGLSFMGKKWDYDVPSVEIWRECLRVLKPGGTALIFAGSRTQHRMAVNVEDAGFILKDCIMWLYGSGFPKATDISKQLDKKAGKSRESAGEGNRETLNAMGGGLKNRCVKCGKPFFSANACKCPKPEAITDDAQLWNGWKSHGLKPAYEPILVAMKPNEGSYANNALEWGVSGLNIDGGRIGTEESLGRLNKSTNDTIYKLGMQSKNDGGLWVDNSTGKGRFPANIILDEEAGRMLDEQSGVSKSTASVRKNRKRNDKNIYGGGDGIPQCDLESLYSDSGGASRFFYCAKASKAERNAGCDGLEEKMQGMSNGAQIHGDGYDKGQGIGLNVVKPMKNFHPTVKPLALMEYLCKLTKTPTGGTVLDPFMGSGTTGVACKNTGRDFVGIEREPDFHKIAESRINHQEKEAGLFGVT